MIFRGILATSLILLALLFASPPGAAEAQSDAWIQIEVTAPGDGPWAGDTAWTEIRTGNGQYVAGVGVPLDEARRFGGFHPGPKRLTLYSIPEGLELESISCDFADDVVTAAADQQVELNLRSETLAHCIFELTEAPVRVSMQARLPSDLAGEELTVKLEGLSGQWRVGRLGWTEAESSLRTPRALRVEEAPLEVSSIRCDYGDVEDAFSSNGDRIEFEANPGDHLRCTVQFPRMWLRWQIDAPAGHEEAEVTVDMGGRERTIGVTPHLFSLSPGSARASIRGLPEGLHVEGVTCTSGYRSHGRPLTSIDRQLFSTGTASVSVEGSDDELLDCEIALAESAALTLSVELPDGFDDAWGEVEATLVSPAEATTVWRPRDDDPFSLPNAPPGTHRIRASLPDPLRVGGIRCVGVDGPSLWWSGAEASIDLEPGVQTDCRIQAGSSDVSVGVEWPGGIADASAMVEDHLGQQMLVGDDRRYVMTEPGDYAATVTLGEGMTVDDVACTEGYWESERVPREVRFEHVEAGVDFVVDAALWETIRCTVGIFDDRLETHSGTERNPFSDPDKGMRDLPLPKKVPDDAGTYDAPREGRWRSVSKPGIAECGGYSFAIPRAVSPNVKVDVRKGGERFVATNFDGKGVRVTADADPDIIGRYIGTMRTQIQGAAVSMDTTFQVVTDELMVGNATLVTKIAGQRCVVSQDLEMTHKGK